MSVDVETSLDFDRIVLISDSGGTARIGPDGSRSSTGSLGVPGGRAMVGTVVVRGEPGRSIRVELPNRIELHAVNGSRIMLQRVVSDLGPSPRLDSTGRLTFRFGGELAISGSVEGEFRGEIPITAEYF